MIIENDTEMPLLLKSLQYVALSEELGNEIIVYRKAGVVFLCHNIWKPLANSWRALHSPIKLVGLKEAFT